MGGGGFLGSIRITLDSTFGGGRKLFLPTYTRKKIINLLLNIITNTSTCHIPVIKPLKWYLHWPLDIYIQQKFNAT